MFRIIHGRTIVMVWSHKCTIHSDCLIAVSSSHGIIDAKVELVSVHDSKGKLFANSIVTQYQHTKVCDIRLSKIRKERPAQDMQIISLAFLPPT